MAKRRQRKIRLTYREHKEEELHNSIRQSCGEGTIMWDYLSSVVAGRVVGNNEFERGVAEGMRALADEILSIAMTKPPKKEVEPQEE